MLSPDVPEFIPRGIQTTNADAGGESLKGKTCVQARDLAQLRQRPNYSRSLPKCSRGQSRSSDEPLSWRLASTNAPSKGRNEVYERPNLNRHGYKKKGNNSGEVIKSGNSGGYTSHGADKWQQNWRSNNSSPDKITQNTYRNKKTNMRFFQGNARPENSYQQKHDVQKGRGGSPVTPSSECKTGNNTRLTVQVEKHRPHVLPTFKHSANVSYGKVLQGNSSVSGLCKSESQTPSEVGLFREDQWPTLGSTRSQATSQIKSDFHSGNFPKENNGGALKMNGISDKNSQNKNAWNVIVLHKPDEERLTSRVVNEKEIKEKVLEWDNWGKVEIDINSDTSSQQMQSKDQFNNTKVVDHKQNLPNIKYKDEQNLSSSNIKSSHEETEPNTKRKATLDSSANPEDKNTGNVPNPEVEGTDPFQWQVKGERKKQTKSKDSGDRADRATVPTKKKILKADSKRDRNSKQLNNLGFSVRKRELEGFGKDKSENEKDALQIKKFSTDKFHRRRENKEKKEILKYSDDAARQAPLQMFSRKVSQTECEEVQKDVQGKCSSVSGHGSNNEISVAAESTKDSTLQSEHTRQTILELRKKRKEEKMRRKEQKLKKAQDLMKSDSKVRVITKDFLESTLAGNASNKRSAKSSVSRLPGLLLSSEEYPSLSHQSVITPRTLSCESTKKKASVAIKRRTNALTKSKGACLKLDSCMWSAQSTEVLEEESSEESDCASSPEVPSYSGALLAPSKKVVVIKLSSEEGINDGTSETSCAAVQKKKVKTRDLIELDLMAVALQSKKNKRRDLVDTEEATTDNVTWKHSATSNRHVGSPSKNARGATAPSLPTKAKGATPVKRGKQKEGKQKKKISCLKKCMQRARQMEVEALLSILQEAKRAQERADKQEITLSQTLPEPEVMCLETNKELRRMASALDIASNEGTFISEQDKLDKNGAESNVDNNDEQKEKCSKTMSSELSYNEKSDSGGGKVVIGVCELAEEMLNGKCEPETQDEVKENAEMIVTTDMTQTDKQKLDSDLTTMKDTTKVTESSATAQIIDTAEVEKAVQDHEKTETNEPVVPVGNIIDSHSDPETSKKLSSLAEELKALQNPIHKKKFREYCDHVITEDVDRVTQQLVESLVKFQERHYKRDPTKARIRRRFVCGLKETTKLMGKMSCIIVAPDIQRSKGPGALDEVVEKMLGQAHSHGVPVIFALSCKRLGRLCLKKVPVSCFGIISYHGAQDKFQMLMQLVPEARKKYQELIACGSRSVPVDDEELNSETEPAKLDVTQEVIAKTSAIISSIIEE